MFSGSLSFFSLPQSPSSPDGHRHTPKPRILPRSNNSVPHLDRGSIVRHGTERLVPGHITVRWPSISAHRPSQAICANRLRQCFIPTNTRDRLILQSNQRIYFPSTLTLFNKDFSLFEHATHPVSIGCSLTNRTAMSDSDTSSLPPSPGLDPTRQLLDPPIPVSSQEQAWRRLVARTVPHDELPSVIEAVLSGRETNVVDLLTGSDAQAFIDIMDEVRYTLLFPRRGQFTPPFPTFFCSGTERARSHIAYPKEMRRSVIQDVCLQRPVSQITKDRAM